jgi:hypothetical protein
MAAAAAWLSYTGLPAWASITAAAWLAAVTTVAPPIVTNRATIDEHRLVNVLMAAALAALPVYHYVVDSGDHGNSALFHYTIDANSPTAQKAFNGEAVWVYTAPSRDTPNPEKWGAGDRVDLTCWLENEGVNWGKVAPGPDWIPMDDLKPELPDQRSPPVCPR